MPTLVTPIGRLVWPAVDEPRRNRNYPEQPPRFECSILFEKGADLSKLKAAATAAAREKFGDDTPEGFRSPFKTGAAIAKYGPEFEGATLMSTWTRTRPTVVDANKEAIDPLSGEVYGGCRGKLAVDCYAYEKGGGGVNFELQAVQKVGEDEVIGGRAKVTAAVFDDPDVSDLM